MFDLNMKHTNTSIRFFIFRALWSVCTEVSISCLYSFVLMLPAASTVTHISVPNNRQIPICLLGLTNEVCYSQRPHTSVCVFCIVIPGKGLAL